MISEIFGYLSGIVILLAFIPYLRDIFLGKTKPERASWLIWGILGSIALASQYAKGASFSLLFNGVQTFGDLFIFILAIRYGIGGFMKRDIFALIGVAIGLVLWYLTKEAALALLIVIFIDGTGTVLTIIKSYENPTTETMSAWILTALGGLLACIAVGKFNIILLAFPFYTFLANLGIIASIKLGLKKQTLNIKN